MVDSEDIIFRISLATAYSALTLLAATLSISPLQKISNRSVSVSTDFRRDLGFWAAVVSLVHVAFGLNVHMRGRMWLLFLKENMNFPFIRTDLFGSANYSGVIATIVLIVLFATSNDWAIAKFGIRKWKRLQRWNYGLFVLVVLHGVLYEIIEKWLSPYIHVFAVVVIIVLVLRLSALLYKRQTIQ
jgi:sulfoxide reductase heme-binding subunit YedZ